MPGILATEGEAGGVGGVGGVGGGWSGWKLFLSLSFFLSDVTRVFIRGFFFWRAVGGWVGGGKGGGGVFFVENAVIIRRVDH